VDRLAAESRPTRPCQEKAKFQTSDFPAARRLKASPAGLVAGTTNMAKAWRSFIFYYERLLWAKPKEERVERLFRLPAEERDTGEAPAEQKSLAERSGRYPMAKRRRYLRGNIDHKLSMTTLGGGEVASSVLADTVVDSAWISSVRANWTINNLTRTANVGPFMCGIAHQDYTSTEIEEWIENLQSWDEGDMIAQEVAKRKIRIVGVFDFAPSDLVKEHATIGTGRPVVTKAKWVISPNETVRIWVYNMGANSVATTVPELRVQGHANLWPQ